MYEQKESKNRAFANSVFNKAQNSNRGSSFIDNRPEAITQRKLQEMADRNSQLKQLRINSTVQRNGEQQDDARPRLMAGVGLGAYSYLVRRLINTPGYQRSFYSIMRNFGTVRAAPRQVQIATLISTAVMAGVSSRIGLPGLFSQFIPGADD